MNIFKGINEKLKEIIREFLYTIPYALGFAFLIIFGTAIFGWMQDFSIIKSCSVYFLGGVMLKFLISGLRINKEAILKEATKEDIRKRFND